jgi:F-type H+-transporting ATPase subunit delta
MRDRKLAVRYARALLSSLQDDPQGTESVDEFLRGLADAMTESPRFRNMMLDPAFSNVERRALLRRLAEQASMPRKLGAFIDTLVEHRRAGSLPSIAEVFHELREEALGIVPAEFSTATPLGPELQERVRGTVERLTGRKVRLSYTVDPSLLGGAVTRVGSVVYDGSLRTQLNQLRRDMAEE